MGVNNIYILYKISQKMKNVYGEFNWQDKMGNGGIVAWTWSTTLPVDHQANSPLLTW